MIPLLARIFIKDYEKYQDTVVRRKYGTLCAIVGIILNVILFAIKYIAGTLSGSIAIIADAMNSISDAGSSLITLVSFKLAGKKPDPTHPFGHGRIEYIAGLIVSFIILYTGVTLLKDSVVKIFNPEPVESSVLIIVILIISILVKLYMSMYNRSTGKKIDSTTMTATATDSLSDVLSTTVVLIATVLANFTTLPVDGYCGAAVSLLVIYAGISAARETVAPLLGMAPDKELVDEIEEIVMSHEGIIGIHDLVVHDYGPGRRMLSLHAEVPGDGDIYKIHDMIDIVEAEIYYKLQIEATIHMDPIDVNDPRRAHFLEVTEKILYDIDPVLKYHDFRIVPGETHTNLVYDVVVPAGYHTSDDELRAKIQDELFKYEKNVYVAITVDTNYSGS